VLWLEVLGAAFALGLLGLYLSMLGRGSSRSSAAAIIVSLLVLVTFDDRPPRRLIQVPATPLLAAKAPMSLPPAAPAPPIRGEATAAAGDDIARRVALSRPSK
jgi:hypothetical protein